MGYLKYKGRDRHAKSRQRLAGHAPELANIKGSI